MNGIQNLFDGDKLGRLGEADTFRFGHESKQPGFHQMLHLFLDERDG